MDSGNLGPKRKKRGKARKPPPITHTVTITEEGMVEAKGPARFVVTGLR
ncbi:MAG TPA: hypothetical protein PK295_04870 [Candidatus Magasanikbacteria bacterium]|nr:hypothetical protein [Candidatus Magasanikbacteria bacterium]